MADGPSWEKELCNGNPVTRSIQVATVAGLHSAGFAEKFPWGTSTEEHRTEAEYFRGEASKEKGWSEDKEERDDRRETKPREVTRTKEDAGPEEAAPEPREGTRTEEDAGPKEAAQEPREGARTEEDAESEPEKDKEQHRERHTVRAPRYVPRGTWFHKVRAYSSK
ncbi:hypothetical protein NDU88_003695 [Pleurodeles waltl]|uniref:Uncharacterized protein n=1 Tax=Pleurodeles waltl TaxID=8319 RepID=A0AAV7RG02_PLEWA|nr:hypothetical protein NDU88_003695 [Pleurodeles waltl]